MSSASLEEELLAGEMGGSGERGIRGRNSVVQLGTTPMYGTGGCTSVPWKGAIHWKT